MIRSRHLLIYGIAMVLVTLFNSCSGSIQEKPQDEYNETQTLLDYLESHGEIINSPSIPSFVEAEEIFKNLKASNYLVIDVRPAELYEKGHIENSVNIEPNAIQGYFENNIEPNAFEKIILVCDNSHLSGYVNAVLMALGYNNVFTLRFGLSSWDQAIAESNWLAIRSSHLEGQLETTAHPKNLPGNLPSINTGYGDGYSILRTRATGILEVTMESMNISIQEVMANPGKYYLINYWPEKLYQQGHLPGAIQYDPKKAFHSSRELLTLPLDKPIVLYCFSGQHSAFVTPMLRLLGYEVYNLAYGANAFMYNTMLTTQPTTRSFKQAFVRGFPLVKPGDNPPPLLQQVQVKQAIQAVQGGC